jgi:hypothetical protein
MENTINGIPKVLNDAVQKLQRRHSYLWWHLARTAVTDIYVLKAYHCGRELWSTHGDESHIMAHINDLLS